jgi:hypothetical protein
MNVSFVIVSCEFVDRIGFVSSLLDASAQFRVQASALRVISNLKVEL